jgi:SAM-dependent methyltransferase
LSDKDQGQEFEFTEEELRDLDKARKNRSSATAPAGDIRKRTAPPMGGVASPGEGEGENVEKDDPVSAHFGEALASPLGPSDPEELPTLPFMRELESQGPTGSASPSSAAADAADDDDDEEGDTEIIVTVDPTADVSRPTEPNFAATRPIGWETPPLPSASRATFDGADEPVLTDSSMFNTAREIPRVKRGAPKPTTETADATDEEKEEEPGELPAKASGKEESAGKETSEESGAAPRKGRLAVLLSALNTHTSPVAPLEAEETVSPAESTKGGGDGAPSFAFPDEDAWRPEQVNEGDASAADDAVDDAVDIDVEALAEDDAKQADGDAKNGEAADEEASEFDDAVETSRDLSSDDVLEEEIEAAPLVDVDMEEEPTERPRKPTIPPPLPHLSGPFPSVVRDEAAVVRVAVEAPEEGEIGGEDEDDGVITSAPSEAELIEGGTASSSQSVEAPPEPVKGPGDAPRVDRLKKTQPLDRAKRSEKEAAPKTSARGLPWFQEIFNEDYTRTTPFATPQFTEIETQLIERSLNPTQESDILDLGCGNGRHALALAARGYRVTGYELSLPFMIQAAEAAQKRKLNVNFVRGDLREMDFEASFDAAYCMGTTFGYFDDETNRSVIQSVFRALRDGGRFFLEVANRDYLIKDLPARIWWEGEGCVVLEEVDFNYFTSRVESKRSVVFDDGRHVEYEISLRAYSLHELGKILHHAGFRVLEVSGNVHHRCRFFGSDSRQLLMLAERR